VIDIGDDSGDLRVTATTGIGVYWLAPRLHKFIALHPDVNVRLIIEDGELDLGQREADIALRMRQPVQSDLIQRKLFDVSYHVYASRDYIKRRGERPHQERTEQRRQARRRQHRRLVVLTIFGQGIGFENVLVAGSPSRPRSDGSHIAEDPRFEIDQSADHVEGQHLSLCEFH
jgi:DNA-binding transcriptional LysR family regulator